MSSIPSFCRQIDFTQGDVIWFIFPPSPLITSLKMCDQNLGRLITWYDKDQWIYSITRSMDVVHHTTERHKLALNLKQVYVMYLFYLISRLFQNWSCAEPRSSWDRILLQSEFDLHQRCLCLMTLPFSSDLVTLMTLLEDPNNLQRHNEPDYCTRGDHYCDNLVQCPLPFHLILGGRNRMFIKYYIFWILNFTFRPELRTWSTITKQIQPISVQKMLQPQNFCEKKLSTENNNSAQNLSRSLYWVETIHWRQILVKNLGNKDVTAEPVFVRPIHECLGDSPPQVISCVSHPSPSPDFHLLLV